MPRDYKIEYARRIARGLSKGLSTSQARGHPRIGESFISPIRQRPYDPQLEFAVRQIRSGKSLTKAAKTVGVSPERVRNYLVNQGLVVKSGSRWTLGRDSRARTMMIFSHGKAIEVTVGLLEEATRIGQYMSDVGQFLASNDTSFLDYWRGQFITDRLQRRHLLETNPNTLYRIAAGVGDDFARIYRIVL